jgi:hypothetical protein
MSNEKQTAIEWLGNEITNRITRRNPHDTIIIQILGETLIELIEQAKEMEKEKIIKIITKYHNSLFYTPLKNGEAEKIYNLTYKCDL